jgi:signal transduction histidine kinase/ActR/RegA family two-component response regulator
MKVVITPPYWKTWWFRTLLYVSIIGGILVLLRMKLRNIRNQNESLEKQVTLRTAEVLDQKKILEVQSKDLQTLNEEQQALNEELQAVNEELQSQTGYLQLLNDELSKQKDEVLKKQSEAEQARIDAERANAAKTIFLATMSHEIRTPMNGVLGMASLLAQTKLSAEQKDYTDTILSSGGTLLTVINDILDFSKIESGNIELDVHTFDIRKCLEEVSLIFQAPAAEKNIILKLTVEEQIPTFIAGDSYRLRQVLNNLLSNAMKFTHSGNIEIQARLQRYLDQGFELAFDVKDTGIGIPEEKLSRLFKPFSQVDSSTTRKYGGTGLGLVISQRLVELMGGTISVQSTEQKGTMFSFTIRCKSEMNLPMPQGNQCHKGNGQSVTVLREDFAERFPLEILAVDDNPINQKLIHHALQKLGYNCTLAENGRDAVEKYTGKIFNVILMDIQMPVLDGIEATRLIRAHQGAQPFIISMTANAFQEDRDRCIAAGMNDYILKPIKLEELVRVLERAALELRS